MKRAMVSNLAADRVELARRAAANKLKIASNKAIIRLDNAATVAAHTLNTSAVEASAKLNESAVAAASKLSASADEASAKLVTAADKAVDKIDNMLLKIGIDVDDPKATVSLKQDIVYAHNMRLTSELVRGQGLKAAVWTLIPALLAFLGYTFRDFWFHH